MNGPSGRVCMFPLGSDYFHLGLNDNNSTITNNTRNSISRHDLTLILLMKTDALYMLPPVEFGLQKVFVGYNRLQQGIEGY